MAYIYVVDISGKVDLYDDALIDALKKKCPSSHSIKLMIPGRGLLSIVPKKFKKSSNLFKRFLKVIEGLLNYLFLIILLTVKKVQILHLQWLPFMEVNAWELFILHLLKIVSPKTLFVLTIHNVYPHNMKEDQKARYKDRFCKTDILIDKYIVHTHVTKIDVIREFEIEAQKINVCCHGVFIPKNVVPQNNSRGEVLKILQFGGQSYYKGTDILVDAACGLPSTYLEKVQIRIVGGIAQQYLQEMQQKDKNGVIQWKPYFLKEEDLNNEINDSDIIILPYRAISQSGVLLLSIFFGKKIICSDLPSFVETMRGEEDDSLDNQIFFKSEDPISLRSLIIKYIDGEIDEKKIQVRIKKLQTLYSWENAALATLQVYGI